ncbi:multicopper oxidase domain-containing protein [Nocardiopsis exhalans]|uniref:Multicopper oxidase domain-containing protein n=1 Tax=Nocardiopsis exhalans TaxID=163604 RepID=A0ABY5DGK9_9ACTN|nr:multicopper oxidase domain-containing protein [Nocardiopsis exhalans]USY22623.1 multicopper oxidase domain-containing protein [Nocardiopsis exhalans]
MPKRPGPLRRIVLWTVSVVAVLALVLTGTGIWVYSALRVTNVGELSFTNELHVPPELEPVIDEDGRKRFDLTMQEGTSEFLPGQETATWGVNGAYLGPTMRLERGDDVAMNVTNDLPETSTLHWHGMRVPAAMDGGPHQQIEPGQAWSPEWTVDQPAASLWYHPHLHGATAEHVYRGVAGMIIVEDDDVTEGLPNDYGVDDLPLLVQDRSFRSDGELDLNATGPLWMQATYGLMGDQILVNGTHDPYFEVESERVRLRVLNGSNTRSMNFGFDDDRAFQLVGTDTGLLPAPVELDRIRLSPGERAEIVVDFDPGDDVVLRSYAPKQAGSFAEDRLAGADDEFDILRLTAAGELTPGEPIPAELATTPEITPPEDATERVFTLGGTAHINGASMDMSRIDEVVPAGATEIWTIENPSVVHNFHIHDVAFRVLDIDGVEPPPELTGRKDTVYVAPNTSVRIAVEFGEHVDPEAPYMYHCHLLEHEDQGMMGQFLVVEPGTEDEVARDLGIDGGHDHAGGHGGH